MSRFLPSKLPSYLLQLSLMYDRSGKLTLRDVIRSCRYTVNEDAKYDSWNGGIYGHEITLYLPIEELLNFSFDEREKICESLLEDLKKLARGVEDKYFVFIRIEMNDENDSEYQRAVPFSPRLPINPDNLSFWKPGSARLFISHRDIHKSEARKLGKFLEPYGISSFVAHDTIQPLTEWRSEIMKGLETMEVMLIYLTDDFDESLWCNQEIGFALGKGVPIISLKLGRKDPPGFISHVQAFRGQIENPEEAARGLFPLIGKALGRQERFHQILINSFVESPSWQDTKDRFDRMVENVAKLSEEQTNQIIASFQLNSQLYQSGYLTSRYDRLKNYLEKATGKIFKIEGKLISEHRPPELINNKSNNNTHDDLPF